MDVLLGQNNLPVNVVKMIYQRPDHTSECKQFIPSKGYIFFSYSIILKKSLSVIIPASFPSLATTNAPILFSFIFFAA